MNIQLVSDLHLDLLDSCWSGEHLIAPVLDADVLVLAGDLIRVAWPWGRSPPWAADRKILILYVAGNHEFYGDSMEAVQQRLLKSSSANGIHYLVRNPRHLDLFADVDH